MNIFIKIPKYVSVNDYELNSDKYLDYVIKKQNEHYLLFEKDNYENDINSFWFIDDIAKSILNKYGKCIFVLTSLNEDNKIDIFIGNTIDISNLNLFSYSNFDIKDLASCKKTINSKVNFLQNSLNSKEGVIIFNYNLNENILIDIFTNIKFVENQENYLQLISKTKYYQKKIDFFLPFVIVGSIFLFLFLISSFYINEYNTKSKELFDNQKNSVNTEISKFNEDNTKLKSKIEEERNKLKLTYLISNELYTEGK